MRKIIVAKGLLVIMLVIVLSMSGGIREASANPYQPLPNGGIRHHIIPNNGSNGLSTVGYNLFVPGNILTTEERTQVRRLCEAFANNVALQARRPNLGEWSSPPNTDVYSARWSDLAAEVIRGTPEAREQLKEMIAWVPGNLVVGLNRGNSDPGNVFDRCAMRCRQTIDNNYPDYSNVWAGVDEQAKRNAIINLAGMDIQEGVANGADCWRLGQNATMCS